MGWKNWNTDTYIYIYQFLILQETWRTMGYFYSTLDNAGTEGKLIEIRQKKNLKDSDWVVVRQWSFFCVCSVTASNKGVTENP